MRSEEKLLELIKAPVKIKNAVIGKYIINYIEAGQHGEPLILLHGANIGWGQWYPNIARLAKYFKVFALDLPGSGGSTRINFKKYNLEKDIVEIVEKFVKLNNLKNTSIVAHSFGGVIALSLVFRNNISINKIILINPMGFSNNVPVKQRIISLYPVARLLAKTVFKPTLINIEKFLTSVMSKNKKMKDEFIMYYYDSIKHKRITHPILFMHSLMKNFKVRQELDLRKHLHKIDKPTLVIVGDKDPLMRDPLKNEYFNLIPKAQIEIFYNVGHVPAIEESAKFNELVIKFVQPKRT